MKDVYVTKAGDRLRGVLIEMYTGDPDETLDLNQYDSVEIYLRAPDGTLVVDGRSVQIVQAAGTKSDPAIVAYYPGADEIVQAGTYEFEVVATLGGLQRTWPSAGQGTIEASAPLRALS